MSKLVSGVYAALSTPRQNDGSLDETSLRKLIDFLLERGIRGFAINGATGEYCLTTSEELKRIVQVASDALPSSAQYVVGIGSAGIQGCVNNGNVAIDHGASGVLLPMPHFFSYTQDDLYAFSENVARRLPIPILLYNLPQFTNGLDSATVHNLLVNCPNIIGIKDSSGSLETLRDLTNNNPQSCRIVGNDSAFADSLRQNISDGVISGVAGVLPELILSIYAHKDESNSAQFKEAVNKLDEFIGQINAFPTPWGLKIIAECRGITSASFSQPLSSQRHAQRQSLERWFKEWQSPIS
ncbi:MAG: dihydrodipicolinate synthase/N-acetylneuraminate lyase [Spirosoma sp.]|nr:dihydrodipicolinate synthase/N-acetylneuraminate lyase [Spirosoma sp.]